VHRRLAPLALVAALGVACSGGGAPGSTDTELRDALTAQLEDGPLDAEAISCVVDYILDATDRDELDRMAEASRPEELSKEQRDIVTDAVLSCS
jgi:hypothetical protein